MIVVETRETSTRPMATPARVAGDQPDHSSQQSAHGLFPDPSVPVEPVIWPPVK